MRHVYESKRPSDASLAAVREAAASITPDEASLAEWYQNYIKYHDVRLAHDMDIVLEHSGEGASILDVGCVPPVLLRALGSTRRLSLSGIDLAPERFASAIEDTGVKVFQVNVETDPLTVEPASQDVIVFNEIFEHLRINPITTLTRVRECLRSGGKLLLSTPNLYSAAGITNLLRRGKAHACAAEPFDEYSKLEKLGHMGHTREYTRQEVVLFLEKVGFRVETIIHRGRSERRFARRLEKINKKLRPFMTVIATPA